MFHTLRARLASAYVILIAAALLLLATLLVNLTENLYLQNLRERLASDSRLVTELVAPLLDSEENAAHHRRFLELLENLAGTDLEQPIGRIEILSPGERRQLGCDGVHHLAGSHARRHPLGVGGKHGNVRVPAGRQLAAQR